MKGLAVTTQETMVTGEQPEAAATAPDSTPDKSLQDGGITPRLAEALAKLSPEDQAAVREDIAQRNAHLTKTSQGIEAQRRALESDVQLAGVFREVMKDSDFNEFLKARESGDLAKHYRQKAQALGVSPDPLLETNNPISSVAPGATGVGESDPSQSDLAKRVEAMEADARAKAQAVEVAQFQQDHPDWRNVHEAMQSANQTNPGLSLENLYYVASGMVEKEKAQAPPADAAEQQVQVEATGEQGAASSSPPLPVGAPPGATTPAHTPPTSVEGAWAQAKEDLGIRGPIEFVND